MRAHVPTHPLTAFFHSRKFTANEGMQWLQGRATERFGTLISDNDIDPEDVCAAETDLILRLAGAEMFIPRERRIAAQFSIPPSLPLL